MSEEKKISANEGELNGLFYEILQGCREDLKEAQDNVDMYVEDIYSSKDNKMVYGPLYNEALKVKGSARDRQIKLLALIKTRVGEKEKMVLSHPKTDETFKNMPDAKSMAKYLEDIKGSLVDQPIIYETYDEDIDDDRGIELEDDNETNEK